MIRKLVSEIEKTIDSSSIVLSSSIQKFFGPGEETVYLKGHVTIIDSSILEIALFAIESAGTLSLDKYRLHYMNSAGQMLFRYDNSPHHPEIDSHPHHKHTPDKIGPSNIPSINDVLKEISAVIVGREI
ncbi:MAG TPA: DUF6516 family protein [Desulfatiglandales bacterium]|nr:DUF6516 family protein [Desulfatiglandales bacterium]